MTNFTELRALLAASAVSRLPRRGLGIMLRDMAIIIGLKDEVDRLTAENERLRATLSEIELLPDAICELEHARRLAAGHFRKEEKAARAALNPEEKVADDRVPILLTSIITALERESGNTDTDPRWIAATELRKVTGWQRRTLVCTIDVRPCSALAALNPKEKP